MRPALGPLHLLLLAEAPADHLIDRGFDKAGADAFAIPIALAIVGDERAISLDIGVELLNGLQQFPRRAIARDGPRHVEVHREGGNLVERFVDVAMPQRPFEALQLLDHKPRHDLRYTSASLNLLYLLLKIL